MKNSIIILFLLFPIVLFSQPLEYQLDIKTEKKVTRWTKSLPKNIRDSIYFRIGRVSSEENRYSISCCTFNINDRWSDLAHYSNRLLNVKGRLYPIVLDYDDSFSILLDNNASPPGSIGHRDGLVRKIWTLFHGHIVYTDKSPIITRKSSANNIPERSPYSGSSRIVYYFNDQIEVGINTIDSTYQKTLEHTPFLVLSSSNSSTKLDYYQIDGHITNLLKRTNRYVLVDSDYVPLFLDYDRIFCTEFIGNEQFMPNVAHMASIEWKPIGDSPSILYF